MNGQRTGRISNLVLACCMAASSRGAAPQNSRAQSPAELRQQVLDLEKEWVNAEVKHDSATLRRILDDKFLASFGPNEPRDKETFIKNITSGDVDSTESQTLTDRRVVLDRDTTVVVGTDTVRGTENGAPYTAVYRYTVTYIYRNGRWVALAEHLVNVQKAN